MEYTIQQLSKMFGITVRTLRHYDQIGLLSPLIRKESGRTLYSY